MEICSDETMTSTMKATVYKRKFENVILVLHLRQPKRDFL